MKEKKAVRIGFVCSGITLFTHLLALSLMLGRMMLLGIKPAIKNARTVDEVMTRWTEIVTIVFVALCMLYLAVVAFLLVIRRIDIRVFLRLQEVFWAVQFLGYSVYEIIMRMITDYAKIDLYWRLMRVCTYDLTTYLILIPPLIYFLVSYIQRRRRK